MVYNTTLTLPGEFLVPAQNHVEPNVFLDIFPIKFDQHQPVIMARELLLPTKSSATHVYTFYPMLPYADQFAPPFSGQVSQTHF